MSLMQVLSAVVPQEGRLEWKSPRAGIVPPSDEERAGLGKSESGGDVLAAQGARPADGEAVAEFYRRTWEEPAVDVHGLSGGSAELQKTVLPVVAEANVSIRLAPGQDGDEISAAMEKLLLEAAPEGAEVEVERLAMGAGGACPSRGEGHPARPGRVRARPGRPPAATSGRRLVAGDGRSRDSEHSDDPHRLRPSRGEHPLAERAPARRAHPAGHRGGQGARPRVAHLQIAA